jgi:hypothetical protein
MKDGDRSKAFRPPSDIEVGTSTDGAEESDTMGSRQAHVLAAGAERALETHVLLAMTGA